MKRLFLILILAVTFCLTYASSDFSAYKGVWSSDDAEAVLTDSICIFYYKSDSTMQAVLEIPVIGISSRTVFEKDGSVTTLPPEEPLSITSENGVLKIDRHILKKVEELNIVKPYDMPQCNSKTDVGRCLQEWRLGAKCGIAEGMIYCEINTNRHMFVYMINPSIVYIRAAAARNNNNGTLFFQNIRMMKNQNTDEYTMYIAPDNYEVSLKDLEIDNTKFQPNTSTLNPDGGIYWSFISFEQDQILLNGCGETYQVNRPASGTDMEYIEYVPYSADDLFIE